MAPITSDWVACPLLAAFNLFGCTIRRCWRPTGRSAGCGRRATGPTNPPQSMQQTWTLLQYNNPVHLGLQVRLKSDWTDQALTQPDWHTLPRPAALLPPPPPGALHGPSSKHGLSSTTMALITSDCVAKMDSPPPPSPKPQLQVMFPPRQHARPGGVHQNTPGCHRRSECAGVLNLRLVVHTN